MKPTIGSWIAYNQNQTLPDISIPSESVMKPATKPYIGPYSQPIIIKGVHDTEIEKLKIGI
ncbi:MAG: hypothetical protein K2O19_00200 [Malacoplasma sp.]|nr:hypothetical protein [Malacoplasma sp.]